MALWRKIIEIAGGVAKIAGPLLPGKAGKIIDAIGKGTDVVREADGRGDKNTDRKH